MKMFRSRAESEKLKSPAPFSSCEEESLLTNNHGGSLSKNATFASSSSSSTTTSPSTTSTSPNPASISPDAILNHIGLGPFQVLAFLLSGLTYFAYGCDISIFIYIEDSIVDQWNITSAQFAILPAVTAVPNVLGALSFSFLLDRFGRWWPFALCTTWMGAFSVASAFATSFPLLVGLRCVTSFAIGGIPGLVFPTVIEFLPVRSRGSVVILNVLMDTLGACLSCGLAWWLIPTYRCDGWRYFIAASAVPTLVATVFRLVFYVESPRYLIASGKEEKAWSVFKTIARFNGKSLSDFDSSNIMINADVVRDHDRDEGQGKSKVRRRSVFVQALQIFRPPYLKWTLPIGLIMITQSFGFLCSLLFLPDFLNKVGGVSRYFTIMVVELARIPGTLLLTIIIEWPGVRRLNSLRFFTALAVVFFLLLTFIQTPVSVSLFLVFIYFSVASLRGLMYTYISELYPTSIRSVTVSFFYIIEALTFMCGSFASNKAANVPQHWIFPALFAAVFFVQLCLSFTLHYEPGGKGLKDNMHQQ